MNISLEKIAPPVAFVVVGLILVLIGAAGVIPIGTPQPAITEPVYRIILVGLGVILIALASFVVWRESVPKQSIRQAPEETKKTLENSHASAHFQEVVVSADRIFHPREAAHSPSFVSMLEQCEELWVVGKDCHGLLTTHFDRIRQAAINGKKIRFLIVDHSNKSLLYTMSASSSTRPESKQRTETAREALTILRRIIADAPKGKVEVKLANFLPTCTCTVFDARKASGRMKVENYGYKISAGQRLSMYLTQEIAPRTFAFYIEQFDNMWDASELLDEKSS
jgi:hypothetical protein